MSIVIITQARVGSTRLPAKVLEAVNGHALLALHLQRLKQVRNANKIVVATTFESNVESIIRLCKEEGVTCFQGSTNDVLDRYAGAARYTDAEIIIRVTSDCPLIDPALIQDLIEFFLLNKPDYCSNTLDDLFPDGQDIEVFHRLALERAWSDATLPSDREHVTPYIKRNSNLMGGSIFKALSYKEGNCYSHIRMTVDEKPDLEAIRLLVEKIGAKAGWQEYAEYILQHPDEFTNQTIQRNEGYLKSIHKDQENG